MVATLSSHWEGYCPLLCYCLVMWATWVSLVTWATKLYINLLRGTIGKQTHKYKTRYNQLQIPVLPKGVGNQSCTTSRYQTPSFYPWESTTSLLPSKGVTTADKKPYPRAGSPRLLVESTTLSLFYRRLLVSHSSCFLLLLIPPVPLMPSLRNHCQEPRRKLSLRVI